MKLQSPHTVLLNGNWAPSVVSSIHSCRQILLRSLLWEKFPFLPFLETAVKLSAIEQRYILIGLE